LYTSASPTPVMITVKDDTGMIIKQFAGVSSGDIIKVRGDSILSPTTTIEITGIVDPDGAGPLPPALVTQTTSVDTSCEVPISRGDTFATTDLGELEIKRVRVISLDDDDDDVPRPQAPFFFEDVNGDLATVTFFLEHDD